MFMSEMTDDHLCNAIRHTWNTIEELYEPSCVALKLLGKDCEVPSKNEIRALNGYYKLCAEARKRKISVREIHRGQRR